MPKITFRSSAATRFAAQTTFSSFAILVSFVLVVCCYAQSPTDVPLPEPQDAGPSYFDAVESHFDRLIHYSIDRYGRTRSGLWVSSIDVLTNELPNQAKLHQHAQDPRLIPGSHLYWDQPMLVAAYEVSRRSGCKCYSDSADSYLRSYFHLAMDPVEGIPLDDRVYFDVRDDQIRGTPCEKGVYRIHTPAWELFWKHDPLLTEKTIQVFAKKRLEDDQGSLYSKAIAIESLAWLARKSDSHDRPVDAAIDVMKRTRYSSPTKAATVFWVKSLARAKLLSEPRVVHEFEQMRSRARDEVAKNTSSSTQVSMLLDLQETHMADPNQADFTIDRVKEFGQAIANKKESWTAHDFAKAIRFYANASVILKQPSLHDRAKEFADDAIAKLYVAESSMFRSHEGSDRCDAADGIGWLFLALMQLDGNDATTTSVLGF